MPGSRLRAAVAGFAIAVVVLLAGSPATAAPATAGPAPSRPPAAAQMVQLTSPNPSPSLIHAGPPPGERNPIEGAAAVIAIVIVALAGFFIYGVIRKGL